MDTSELLAIGAFALRCGVSEHHLRRLCRAGQIRYRVVNRARVFGAGQVEEVRAAAREAGYLPPEPAPAPACHQ